jgi:hypothetical protein
VLLSAQHAYSNHYELLCASDFSICHPDLLLLRPHYVAASSPTIYQKK